jgi:dihydroflavonol-4-reductase
MPDSTAERPRPRILVTGAAGYTGLALACSLVAGGMAVRGLIRRASQEAGLINAGVEAMVGDVRDPAAVERALDGVDLVYHVAAVFRRAGIPDDEYRTVHVDGTRVVVERAAAAGVQRLVHCSTIGVHGDVGSRPGNEDSPFRPGDVYQRTKLEGEQMAVECATRLGVPFTVVRPGPIYGPGEHRFRKMIGGVARRRFVVVGSGTTRFQMVYIDDLLEGIRLAGNTPAAVGRTYIITGREAPTLNELVREIADVAGVAPRAWRVPLWPVWLAGAVCEAICVPLRIEPPLYRRRVRFFTSNRWFDTSRARDELGYVPKTSLREGLRRTLASYRELGWV